MNRIIFGAICCLGFVLFGQVTCGGIMRYSMPSIVMSGDNASFSCEYYGGGPGLFAQWYFNDEEFYNYDSQKQPPLSKYIIFPDSGLEVDPTESQYMRLKLISVKRENSGKYTCKMTDNSDPYNYRGKSDYRSQSMLVLQKPKNPPHIIIDCKNTLENSFLFDDKITVTCISEFSYPPVNFTWTVNGNKYAFKHSFFDPADESFNVDTLNTITLNINDKLMESSKDDSKFILKCETNIYDKYQDSTEKEILVTRKT